MHDPLFSEVAPGTTTLTTNLGYRVGSNGYEPPEDRMRTIVNFPETVVELRRYLGMINYYRRCLPHAAHILVPLNEHLKDTNGRSSGMLDLRRLFGNRRSRWHPR
jgi:hypothetical protein